ncbi:phytochrome family protein [Pedobacter duraquae]|uniref:MASE11 domain-containing protein n=1 Tax=Pedobacter duraquae TaxID=425511 RepID=A0A4R6IGQ0_9SPHI|nr:hypothetical protein [Pedobacter duraquae]TDO20918.1 hypothetical protein CLV32_3554 [Pedobacter duraquae]
MLKKENIITLSMKRAWRNYKRHVHEGSMSGAQSTQKDIHYWRNQLFIIVIIYALPMTALTVLPIIVIKCFRGQFLSAWIDAVCSVSTAIILLNRHLSMRSRKLFMGMIIIIFSTLTTIIMGSFEIGGFYLAALSIFIALSFSRKSAYLSLVANLIWCICFYCVIRFKWINTQLLIRYTTSTWIITAMNFILINSTLVILVLYLIERLKYMVSQAEDRATALQLQHEKLKDIAYMQSHLVRAPLAKIISLANLIQLEKQKESDQQLYHHLATSTKELDKVISEIVHQTKNVTDPGDQG